MVREWMSTLISFANINVQQVILAIFLRRIVYIGQTRRHIHTRISEHMGVSSKTGNTAISS